MDLLVPLDLQDQPDLLVWMAIVTIQKRQQL